MKTAPSRFSRLSRGRRGRKARRALAEAGFVALVLSVAWADATRPVWGIDRNWTGATNPFWSEPSNWSPAGTPQTGDRLVFGAVSDSNRSMVNDVTGLSVLGLRFAKNNYQVGGNVVSFSGGIDTDYVLGGSFTVTINCPLLFPNGGIIATLPGRGGLAVGADTVELDLNGPITVSGGQLLVEASAVYPNGLGLAGGKSHILIRGQISGAGDVLAEGIYLDSNSGYIEFDGSQANTFTGTLRLGTYKSAFLTTKPPSITFNNTVGAVVSTRLEVSSGDQIQLTLNGAGQIGANTTVAVLNGSVLNLSGNNQTVQSLVLTNNDAQGSSVLNTGGLLIGLNGGVQSSSGPSAFPIIQGAINLNGYLGMDVSGGGLAIQATIEGNGYVKTGNGTLRLSGNNSNWGDIEATAGMIEARTATAFGVSGNPAYGVHLEGGNITLQNVAIGAQPLFVSPLSQGNSFLYAIGQCSWAGPVELDDTINVVPTANSVMNFSGVLYGAGGLNAGFFAAGTVQLSGASVNTFTGPTRVNGQLLLLEKPYGVGALIGALSVGDAGGASEVRWGNAYQAKGPWLTVYPQALVNLNGFNEDFQVVTFNGGQVQTGTGQFAIYGPLTVNPTNAPAVISGNLGLPPGGPATIKVWRGTGDSDLVLDGVVFGAAPQLLKLGTGSVVMTGTSGNTYSGDTWVKEGSLIIQKPAGVTAIPGHVIVGNAYTGILSLPAALIQQSSFNIIGSVTVNATGFWDLSGQAEGFGIPDLQGHTPITLNGGGSIDTGSSGIIYLPVGYGIDVSPGFRHGSLISGNIGLDPGAHPFNIVARTGNSGPECTIDAVIGQTSTSAAPIKMGTGTLVLSGANTYAGATEVANGTLQIDGAQPQSTVLVDAATTLSGSGEVGNIALGLNSDTIAPGDGPGVPTSLSCGNFNPLSGGAGVFSVTLNASSSGLGYSQLDVRNNVNLVGVTLNATLNSLGKQGEQFIIIRNLGGNPVTGTFTGLPEGATLSIGGALFQITYAGGLGVSGGHDVVLTQLSPGPPTLRIARAAPGTLQLLWPTNAPGYGLQSNTNLHTTNWVAVGPGPTVVGTNNVVTTSGGVRGFYRLFKP
jgi:autotransporter-associated beta strand protein